jgi:hypothetical protein
MPWRVARGILCRVNVASDRDAPHPRASATGALLAIGATGALFVAALVSFVISTGGQPAARLFEAAGPPGWVVLAFAVLGTAATAFLGAIVAGGRPLPTAVLALAPAALVLVGLGGVGLGYLQIQEALEISSPEWAGEILVGSLAIALMPWLLALLLSSALLAGGAISLALRGRLGPGEARVADTWLVAGVGMVAVVVAAVMSHPDLPWTLPHLLLFGLAGVLALALAAGRPRGEDASEGGQHELWAIVGLGTTALVLVASAAQIHALSVSLFAMVSAAPDQRAALLQLVIVRRVYDLAFLQTLPVIGALLLTSLVALWRRGRPASGFTVRLPATVATVALLLLPVLPSLILPARIMEMAEEATRPPTSAVAFSFPGEAIRLPLAPLPVWNRLPRFEQPTLAMAGDRFWFDGDPVGRDDLATVLRADLEVGGHDLDAFPVGARPFYLAADRDVPLAKVMDVLETVASQLGWLSVTLLATPEAELEGSGLVQLALLVKPRTEAPDEPEDSDAWGPVLELTTLEPPPMTVADLPAHLVRLDAPVGTPVVLRR